MAALPKGPTAPKAPPPRHLLQTPILKATETAALRAQILSFGRSHDLQPRTLEGLRLLPMEAAQKIMNYISTARSEKCKTDWFVRDLIGNAASLNGDQTHPINSKNDWFVRDLIGNAASLNGDQTHPINSGLVPEVVTSSEDQRVTDVLNFVSSEIEAQATSQGAPTIKSIFEAVDLHKKGSSFPVAPAAVASLPLRCDECGAAFSNLDLLRLHKDHTCPKKSIDSSAAPAHAQSTGYGAEETCDACGATCANLDQLRLHKAGKKSISSSRRTIEGCTNLKRSTAPLTGTSGGAASAASTTTGRSRWDPEFAAPKAAAGKLESKLFPQAWPRDGAPASKAKGSRSPGELQAMTPDDFVPMVSLFAASLPPEPTLPAKWSCAKCDEPNKAERAVCNNCNAPKPKESVPVLPPKHAVKSGAPARPMGMPMGMPPPGYFNPWMPQMCAGFPMYPGYGAAMQGGSQKSAEKAKKKKKGKSSSRSRSRERKHKGRRKSSRKRRRRSKSSTADPTPVPPRATLRSRSRGRTNSKAAGHPMPNKKSEASGSGHGSMSRSERIISDLSPFHEDVGRRPDRSAGDKYPDRGSTSRRAPDNPSIDDGRRFHRTGADLPDFREAVRNDFSRSSEHGQPASGVRSAPAEAVSRKEIPAEVLPAKAAEDVSGPGVWGLLSDVMSEDQYEDQHQRPVEDYGGENGEGFTEYPAEDGAEELPVDELATALPEYGALREEVIENDPADWPDDSPEGQLRDWLSGLDSGRGNMLQYFDVLKREFAADLGRVAEMKLSTPSSAGIMGTIDTYFWELCGVRQMGHRLLLAKGINALAA